jgi:uncharacterized membrane protein YdjX (TVP38/TMEM64 family)
MTRRLLRVLLLVLVTGAVIWLFASGNYRALHAERIRDELRALGALGPLVFLLLFALIQPLGPSGHLFVLGGSLVWPPVWAFVLGLSGAVLSQLAAFFFYRYVLHDWAQARIPERFKRFEHRLVEKPFRTVLVLRLLTFTWQLVPMALGVSRVRFMPMLLGTVLGLVPLVAFDVWIGESVSAWLFGK